jgi:hypothetical protein
MELAARRSGASVQLPVWASKYLGQHFVTSSPNMSPASEHYLGLSGGDALISLK